MPLPDVSTAFGRAFARTVGNEGDFSNDARDSGGATRYGITEAVARAYGYTGAMADLPFSLALQIAKQAYWDELSLDQIAAVYEPVAAELFDTAYNMGQGIAAQFLERCLNAFLLKSPVLAVDGAIGQATLHALRTFQSARGAEGCTVLLHAIECLKGDRYIEIAEKNPAKKTFVYGWIRTRVTL